MPDWLGITSLLIAVIAAIVLIALFVTGWFTSRSVAAGMTAQVGQAVVSQQSLVWGALCSLVFAMLIDNYVGEFVLGLVFLGDDFEAHVILTLAVASLVYVAGLHDIQTGFRAAIMIFGKRRLLKRGWGLSEGYQWVPPLFTNLKELDCRTQKLDLSDEEGAYTRDDALMSLKGYLLYNIYDPYRYLGYTKPEEMLRGLGLQTLRIQTKNMDAVALRNIDKKDFSEIVAEGLHAELARTDNPRANGWGLNTGMLVMEDVWPTRDELAKAWNARVTEVAEGVAEQIQVERRIAQIEKLKAAGVEPHLAAAMAQVEVEKPGATVHTVNVPGLQEGIAKIADSISLAVKNFFEQKGAAS